MGDDCHPDRECQRDIHLSSRLAARAVTILEKANIGLGLEITRWRESERLRKVYVDGDKVAMAIAQRITAKQKAKHAVRSGASA